MKVESFDHGEDESEELVDHGDDLVVTMRVESFDHDEELVVTMRVESFDHAFVKRSPETLLLREEPLACLWNLLEIRTRADDEQHDHEQALETIRCIALDCVMSLCQGRGGNKAQQKRKKLSPFVIEGGGEDYQTLGEGFERRV